MWTLDYTALLVTVAVGVLLVLLRVTEHTSPVTMGTERIVAQMIDLSDLYCEDAGTATDDIERLRFRAQALSLLRLANTLLPREHLERLSGYSVRRRIRQLEQQVSSVNQNPTTGDTK